MTDSLLLKVCQSRENLSEPGSGLVLVDAAGGRAPHVFPETSVEISPRHVGVDAKEVGFVLQGVGEANDVGVIVSEELHGGEFFDGVFEVTASKLLEFGPVDDLCVWRGNGDVG